MKRIIKNLWGGFLSLGVTVAATAIAPSGYAGCTPPPAGMVAWWPGEGTANDILGGNNGTWSGTAGYSAGEVGQAFSFDGASGITVNDAPALNPTNGLTIEYWVYPYARPAYNWSQTVVSKDNYPLGNHEYMLEIGDSSSHPGAGDFRAHVNVPSGFVIVDGATVVQSNTWYHVAETYDGSALKLYVNGVLDGQAAAPGPMILTGEPVRMGSGPVGAWAYPFTGLLDEPAIYNRALSSNEIAAIYQAGSAGKCTAAPPAPTSVPFISNFSPASGSNGVVVSISGTNFSATPASDIVYFGGVRAEVVFANPSMLLAKVPAGATYAPITVTVNGLTAWANAPFLPSTENGGSNSIALGPRLDLPAGNGPGQTILADVDGDGKPDLVVNSGSAALSIYRNISTNGAPIGAASFAPRVDVAMPGNIQNGVMMDLDGDGKLDFAVLDRDLKQVHIFRNTASSGVVTSNSFAWALNLTTGNDPRGILVRDLDGDGLPDIAVANWADSTVMVFRNLGTTNGIRTNSFAAPVVFSVGAQPQDLKAADLDGDGRPDLVTANNNYGTTNSVSLLRNTSSAGTIAFAPEVGLAGLPTAYCLAIGDLDGDGKADLVVSSFDQGQAVSVFHNVSSPGTLTTDSFESHVDFALPGWGNGVAIGDLDGDGKPDLAVVTQLGDGLSVFKNTSSPGSFTVASLASRQDYPTGWNPNGVAIGDLDGDGRPDIAFAVDYAATVSVYQNLSSPVVNPPPTPTTNPPAISSINPATAAMGTTIAITGTNFSPVASADTVYFGSVRAAVSSASATSLMVTVPAGAIFAPITVTVNGLTAYSSQPFEPTFAGAGAAIGNTTLGGSFNLPTLNGPFRVIMADFDGDGRPDLALANGSAGVVAIYQNLGTGGALTASTFAPPVLLTLSNNGSPNGLAAADLDGDGKLDLVASDVQNSQMVVWRNISSGGILTSNSFASPVTFAVGANPRAIAVTDLDGDGRPDIISINNKDGTVSILRNTGSPGSIASGSFAPRVDLAMAGSGEGMAVADLDGDGKPDIVVVDSGASFISLFRNRCTPGNISTGTFDARVDLPAQDNSIGVAIGDLDGDGKPEIVTTAYLPQNMSVYQNLASPGSLSTNSFAAPVTYPLAGRGHTIALSDLNGDGKLDIAEVTELNSALSLFQNVGTGSFTISSLGPRVDFGTGWNAWGVAVGDLDGDGRPDVVFANSYDNTLTVYQNQAPFGGSSGGTNNVPVITAVSPLTAAPGSTITISGASFDPFAASDIVRFGAVRANVSAASSTSLTVTLPPGATFGPVTVAADGLTAYSSQLFNPTFSGAGSNVTSSSFAPSFNIPTDGGPGSIVIADLDGDGLPDVSFVTDANVVCVLRNISTNGTLLSAASFAPAVELQFPTNGTAGSAYRLRAVDLDGDGKLDLIACEVNGNRVSVFHNVSTPGTLTTNSFEPAFALIADTDCRGVAAADLDADGRVDIVGLNYGAKTISIFKKIGTTGTLNAASFAAPITLAAPGGPYEAVIADLDGDGKPDLAFVQNDNNLVGIYQNQASPGMLDTNSFAPRIDLPGGTEPETITAVDLDGDGKLDLVTGSVQGDNVNVYRNVSSGGSLSVSSFAAQVDFGTPGWMHTVSVADFNGDGKPDLAVVGELPSYMGIFQNTSTPGSFDTSSLAPLATFGTGWNAWGVAAGDLDGDGRPDVVFCNYYDHNIQIYQNEMPVGATPVAPAIFSQPTNLTVTVNGTAEFSVGATGTPAPGYQWSFNGSNILDATSATLILTNVQPEQGGIYSVSVFNSAGSVASSNAVLTVYVPPTPPAIVSQTPSQVLLLGSDAVFGVTASGSAPLSYFWSRNGRPIPGATNASFTLFDAQLTDSGSKFACLVTNAYGTALSTNVSLKVIDTISNDLCSGAVPITTYSYTNAQSTADASSYGDPQPDCVDGFGNGVWYRFTAPVSGILSVDTFGSDFDTGLGVYAGSCDSLTEVDCDDDSSMGVTSQVSVPAVGGTAYYFLAGGYGGHVGNLVFHMNYYTPPAISGPTNLAVVVSSNAIFSTAVSGTMPMTFQWYFNNSPLTDDGRINGSTNVTLTIADVQTNDGGNYYLVASNWVGATTSAVAVLTPVILPPSFVQPPVSQSVGMGSNANFSATIDGTPPYGYQWSFAGLPLMDDGVHITGSTTSSLNISNLTAADAGDYTLTVSNVSGQVSATASLTVLVPPIITFQPAGRSVPPGLPTTFTVTATGIPTPSYQWQLNGTNIPGATFANLTIPAVGSNNLGNYQLVASNLMGVVVSSNAPLTFGPVAAWGRNLSGECLPPPGLSNVVSVAGIYQSSYALLADGTIRVWGSRPQSTIPATGTNVVGLFTDGSTALAALRADGSLVTWGGYAAPPLSNVVSVALGFNAGLALRAEGSVVGWGYAPASQVPPRLNHVTAIAAGYMDALALRNDGTLVAWGTGPATNIPAGLANVTAIAAGPYYNLALRSNGTVVAWGTGIITNLPPGLTNIVAISASPYVQTPNLCLAIRANGTVVAWGDSPYGEANPPPALSNLLSVAIAAAPNHGLALINDGRPQILHQPIGLTANVGRDVTLSAVAAGAAPLSYQWLLNGTNIPAATNSALMLPNISSAQAGNYQLLVSNSVATAVSLPALVNVVSNSQLMFLSQNSVSATNVYQGGTAKFYGGAVLGNGPLKYQWFSSPSASNFVAVAGGTNDTLMLDPALAVQSGSYYLAVSNAFTGINLLSLGKGSTSSLVPINVQFARAWGYQAVSNPPVNVTNAVAIATGGSSGITGSHYLALTADGKVKAWASGFVSYGETNVSALSGSFVVAIAAGYQQSLALKSDGTVYAWGYPFYGQTNVPAGLNNVVAIACGGYHDLALKADGTVVGWGALQAPQYGQATNYYGATNVVAIAAGTAHSMALRADGTVAAWGDPYTTVIPFGVTNVVAIAAGNGFSDALRADGTVVQWGRVTSPLPTALSNVVAISASGTHSSALRNDGTVVSWGTEYSTLASNNVPADLTNVVAITSGGDHDFGLLGTRAPTYTVQPWDRSFVAGSTARIVLAGKCAGAQPVTYQWRLNGTNIPGATSDSLILTNQPLPTAQPRFIQPGGYQLMASNAYGVTFSRPAKVTSVIPLNVALNASNVVWTTTGNAQWYGQTNYSHDGLSAARSGGIGGSQETILQATLVTNLAGAVSFWWKVSSEQYFDVLEFRVNGTTMASISGEVDWQQFTLPLSAGTNVLQWRYSKDPTFDSGLDSGFVDQFAFLLAPKIVVQPPPSVTVNQGTTINLSVVASGAPTLGYQWQQNGNPVGGNSPLLILPGASRAQDGVYSVTVTNVGGATVSSNALVQVNVPQVLGTPTLLPGGTLQFTASDAGGGNTLSPSDLSRFEAQASGDMVNWVTLPNALSVTNGMLLLQDTSGTNYTSRFYRIVEH